MSHQDSSCRGLYTDRLFGSHRLIIEPGNAVFKMQCIFTNEAVDSLTLMKLHDIQVERNALGRRTARERIFEFLLPVSNSWIEKRADHKKRVGRIIMKGGLVIATLAVAFIAFCILLPSVLSDEAKALGSGITLAIGLMGIVIGWAWPRLEGSQADPMAIPALFVDDTESEDYVIIPHVHQDYVADLPKWKGNPTTPV